MVFSGENCKVAVRTRTSRRRRWWRRMAVALEEVWGRVKNVCKQNGLLILSVLAVVIGCLLGFFLRGKQLSEQVSCLEMLGDCDSWFPPSHPPAHLPTCLTSSLKYHSLCLKSQDRFRHHNSQCKRLHLIPSSLHVHL